MHSSKTTLWLSYACLVLFVCLSAAGKSRAQAPQGVNTAPDIQILKLHWEKQVRLPNNFDPSVIPTGTTFSDPTTRSSGPTTTAVSDAPRAGGPIGNRASPSNSSVTFPATPGRLPIFYVYSLRIKNDGAKMIEGIAWDYLFIDPKSDKEMGRHQFLSYARIASTKVSLLQAQLRSPPVRVVASPDSTKSEPQNHSERAVIQCILYADGSVWKNTQGREGVCDLLRNSNPRVKRKHANQSVVGGEI
jgi:hypothetical protein